MSACLSVLVVDDEPLARSRMRTLLGNCHTPDVTRVAEAAHAVAAMDLLSREAFDVILLDIEMSGMDGLRFAEHLKSLPQAPVVVFVTAHPGHALEAFELAALDYLTKPVRLERLQAALQKAQRYQSALHGSAPDEALERDAHTLLIQARGRTERVSLDEVLYIKAELKYLTVRTAQASHLLEGSLNDLATRHGSRFVRVHRNALVAQHAMRALEKQSAKASGEDVWVLRLHGVDELIAVSRRQVSTVRMMLARP